MILAHRPHPRRTTRLATLLAPLALALACRGVDETTAPRHAVTSPDYAVYDAVLDGLFGAPASDGGAPFYVIDDSTEAASDQDVRVAGFVTDAFGPQLAPILAAVRPDFAARAGVRVPLDAHGFRARGRVTLFERAAVTGTHDPFDYWHRFYARYPGARGHISFSRPGYDPSGTHALLAYGHGCGSLCGDWGYVLLERRDGRWTVLKRVITIVS